MDNVTTLIMRRMRTPLIALISAYSIAILGFSLIPGEAPDGTPDRMDFLHAFYFVSHMATTIGFGEIPHAFTPAQRLWASLCIYLTVIAWIYAIGSILALLQNEALQQVMARRRFRRRVSSHKEPFYIVCGYGQTGSLVIHSMSRLHMKAVVVEQSRERVSALQLESLGIPALSADAARPGNLLDAGLKQPQCAGVLALNGEDQDNLTVAIAAKLINPKCPVIARANHSDVQANLASFGTDVILNPFEIFGERLGLALRSQALHLASTWLAGMPGDRLPEPVMPPKGTWVIAGYGRFGRAVDKHLQFAGLPTRVIDNYLSDEEMFRGAITGRGTEAVTLRAADIEEAVAVVAGTDDDSDNLSIIMTARDLNGGLFTVARQNRRDNTPMFEAARLDVVMQPSQTLMGRIMPQITTPLLVEFLRGAQHKRAEWANVLVSRLCAVTNDHVPEVWDQTLDASLPMLHQVLTGGHPVTISQLLWDPRTAQPVRDCLVLLLRQGGKDSLLPDGDRTLAPNDRLLLCGTARARGRLRILWSHPSLVHLMLFGRPHEQSLVWRALRRHWPSLRRAKRPATGSPAR